MVLSVFEITAGAGKWGEFHRIADGPESKLVNALNKLLNSPLLRVLYYLSRRRKSNPLCAKNSDLREMNPLDLDRIRVDKWPNRIVHPRNLPTKEKHQQEPS